MQDGPSTTRGIARVALALFVGGVLLPLGAFVVLIKVVVVPTMSAATIAMAGGLGFTWLLALCLGAVGWRHSTGKATAIGTVILGVLAAVVVWQQISQPKSELDGSWKGISFEGTDGKRDDVKAVATHLTIAGEQMKLTISTLSGEIHCVIATDATQNPKAFDARGSKILKEGTASIDWVGIYEREGDTLRLCYVWKGHGERPKEFKSNPAELLILKLDKQ
jgi:uncharacterized protein (TIGR03067 family)